jgi:hypothetical protein
MVLSQTTTGGTLQFLLNDPQAQTIFVGMQFYQLAIGARFECPGRQFTKVAPSMAQDTDRNGNAFWSDTEVTPIGEPLLLPEVEAELWKPDESSHWVKLMRSLVANPDRE